MLAEDISSHLHDVCWAIVVSYLVDPANKENTWHDIANLAFASQHIINVSIPSATLITPLYMQKERIEAVKKDIEDLVKTSYGRLVEREAEKPVKKSTIVGALSTVFSFTPLSALVPLGIGK